MSNAIEIEGFSKSFGKVKAVDNFNIDVKEGEIFAFLGSNGSGKTTTIRCLLDIYSPDEGRLEILGNKYTSKMNHLIGYLPEERGIYTKAKLIDLFMYFGALRGLSSAQTKKLSLEYLERVSLIDHMNKKISQMSSGMQQKAQIGLTIIHNPKVLILDEPFKGLDPVNRQLFIEIFTELNNSGTTIIYSTHVVDEAQKMSNRLVMIKNGKRVLYGTVDEVRSGMGSQNIHLEFSNKLPNNEKLYQIRLTHKSAELIPNEGVDTNEILKFLIKEGVRITSYKVDKPSLNEIFIKLAKTKDEQ